MSLEQIRAFLAGKRGVQFEGAESEGDVRLGEADAASSSSITCKAKRSKGLVRRYLEKMTGLSRAQVTRLIGQYLATAER